MDEAIEINSKSNVKLAEHVIEKCKYKNFIGALLYVANGTRPDVVCSVNYLSWLQNSYDKTHMLCYYWNICVIQNI